MVSQLWFNFLTVGSGGADLLKEAYFSLTICCAQIVQVL